ncbi:MAG: hydrolase [Myxococcota bacterium]
MLVESPFRPAWWLRGHHAQTLWAGLARRVPTVALRWETLELPDGDALELAWVDQERPPGTPIVAVLHGLAGSVDSPHVMGLLAALNERGWRAVCVHFRGTGRAPNRLPIGYHSGKTDDPREALRQLNERDPAAPLAVVGFSLGANVTLKMLGEDGDQSLVSAGVAVSPPLVLDECVRRMESGLSRFYQHHLLTQLKAWVRAGPAAKRVDADVLRRARSFRDFDNAVTAPLGGFDDADHYYRACASRPFLPQIRVPTLVIHAEQDPFFTPAVVPTPDELPPNVRFELSVCGGHVGFVEGRLPGRGRYFVDQRAPDYLANYLE